VNLDHVVLGAILAKPTLLKEVWGFEDGDLEAAMNALRSGKKEGLAQWLNRHGVKTNGEMLPVVLASHEKEVIGSRIRKVSKKIQAATALQATTRLGELTAELKGLLEKHEANAVKTKDAVTKQVAPAKPVNTQANASQEGLEETKGAGVSTGRSMVRESEGWPAY